jgi:uncharacterized membrane protein (UPF0127 family)
MPRSIIIQNLNKRLATPAHVRWCDSFLCRLRGLMFRRSLARQEGVLLAIGRDSRADSSIHMFFVPFDLAVFWINSKMEVVDKVLARPWRPAYFPGAAARYTLELHGERIGDYDIGDRVRFRDA